MFRLSLKLLVASLLAWLALQAQAATAFEDTMAQRTLACVACHGKQGRAGPDGYYPRIAGKPVGYLYNQLQNFRQGKRHYSLMTGLIDPLSDRYLMEIAQYFSQLDLPYPAPLAATAAPAVLEQGRRLATQGEPTRKLPACTQCHGLALTGVAPNVPGLLGLPRDYLNAQLGGWKTGQRQAQEPDCMAHIAGVLSQQEVSAVAHWLAAQALPSNPRAATSAPPNPAGSISLRCGSTAKLKEPPHDALPEPLSQGAYLARAGNCMACHTTRGGAPFAGGRAITTPFGTVYSSNITPDATSGLGRWTSQDFWQAMHHGQSRDGRLLNPAFPFPNFTLMTRADTDALFAFLKTVPPSPQANIAHALRWPFGTSTALSVWRALYFSADVYQADARESADWNRGAYLVRGLGHCGACHTPRNALGATQNALNLTGSMIPMQNWFAPSLISPPEAGVAGAPPAHFTQLLKTGHSPTAVVTGPMAEVVQGSTQYLTDSDLGAMRLYLESLTPSAPANTAPQKHTDAATPATHPGAKLYETHCASCHGAQGEGVNGAYPALAHNRAVTQPNTRNLMQMVLYGGYAPTTAGNPRPFGMPPFVLTLKDKETAALLSYIRRNWGNRAEQVSELDVTHARERP